MVTLSDELETIDSQVHTLAKQAIASHGGNFKDTFVQFFKTAPEDFHLRRDTWAISYEHIDQNTEITSIGQDAERETTGKLRVTFSLPGKSVKDTSRQDHEQADNWGNNQLTTRESTRREEWQTCRRVANEFGDLFLRCSLRGVYIGFETEDEEPQPVQRNLVFFSTTVTIEYKIWWN